MSKVALKEKKKVVVPSEREDEAEEVQESPDPSNNVRMSKMTVVHGYVNQIKTALELRSFMKVYETIDGEEERVDVTPKDLEAKELAGRFNKLSEFIDRNALGVSADADRSSNTATIRSTTRLGGFRVSMNDILLGIGDSCLVLQDEDSSLRLSDSSEFQMQKEFNQNFINVRLSISDDIFLYEQCSNTVIKESEEAARVMDDNRIYDYLTIGKGKVRRISENEAQTLDALLKTRSTNTVPVSSTEKGSYVSYYDMFETYQQLVTKSTLMSIISELEVEHKKTQDEICSEIGNLESFKLASMIMTRILAGNEYEAGMRRFRNMPPIKVDNSELMIKYTLRMLFKYTNLDIGSDRKAISSMSFCHRNGDILAVAYGIYSLSTMRPPSNGYVCIWNIKNPGDPERIYLYKCPVVCVEFSPYVPSLLAIGLYDGTVEVRDISHAEGPPLTTSKNTYSATSVEPIMALKWLKVKDSDDPQEYEPLLGLSQNGTVRKYRINATPDLSAFTIMTLERVEGMPEGLPVKIDSSAVHPLQANRHPQGLNLTIHPLHPDIYFVCTDEGCLVKCSTNYAHQYLELLRTHDGAIQQMDFSPWSPKLFATCGNDWYIRIWMTGIFTPLVSLRSSYAPVHCVFFSRTHSTIILALTRKTFDIWDIRRNLLAPMSSTEVDVSYFTTTTIANCGKSVAIGNNRGNVLICALDDMPKPPHFQYEDLEKALFKAVSTDPDLINELKSIGYFGYPKPAEI